MKNIPFISISSFVISIFTALILLSSYRTQLKYQRLKYISDLYKNYYYILYELRQKANDNSLSVELYYRSYWSQLHREYEAWQNRIVTNELYIRWLKQEKEQYDDVNCKVGGKTYKEAYEQYIEKNFRKVVGDDFINFMNKLFENHNSDAVKKLVVESHHRKHWITNFF